MTTQPQASGWHCSAIGSADATPAVADAVSNLLERVEGLDPPHTLGLLRSAGRTYLLSAADIGWSERARLRLIARRLRDPDIAMEWRAYDGVPRDPAAQNRVQAAVLVSGFVCLLRARAEYHGLVITPLGEMVLAPGNSVHLVDPGELSIKVELRATDPQGLNLGEIIALSGRSGIYAGLVSRHRPANANIAIQDSSGVIVFKVNTGGRPAGEFRIATRQPDIGVPGRGRDKPPDPAVASSAPAGTAAPVAGVPLEPTNPVPAVVTAANAVAGHAAPTSVPEPVPHPVAARSEDVYASAMRKLMALQGRSGVRSVSELTYLHPAVDALRSLRP